MVLYHAFPAGLKGGFTGVDVFFVISGYLITSIIFGSLESGKFRLSQFYGRRIRRIFPALILVFSASLLLGALLLWPHELERLAWHVLAGAGFLANLAYWSESGYFDIAAELKPLLHLWSLGVEEQFYMVWPLLVWAAWWLRLRPLVLIAGLALLSFGLSLWALGTAPVAAFFAPHLRFWELLVGASLAAWAGQASQARLGLRGRVLAAPLQAMIDKWPVAVKRPAAWWRNLASCVGAGLLVIGMVAINKKVAFPGVAALLPVVGSALLIAAGPAAWVNRQLLSRRPLVWVGLISYPLYLWHWPLLTFARIVEDGAPSRLVRLALVALAVLLAWLTLLLIERPLRLGGHGRIKVGLLIGLMLAVCATAGWIYRSDGLPSRLQGQNVRKVYDLPNSLQDPGYTTSPLFRQVFGDVAPIKMRDFLLTSGPSDQPRWAIMGDSHANRLYLGLAEHEDGPLVNLGRGTCPSLLDVDIKLKTDQSIDCQPLTRQTLDYALTSPDVSALILSAFYLAYNRDVLLVAPDGKPALMPEALAKTLAYLLRGRKPIVLVLDVPEVPGSCYETQRGVPIWQASQTARCTFDQADQERLNEELLSALPLDLRHHPRLTILDPSEVLCEQRLCEEIDPANYLYGRDGNHLNTFGTARVGAWLAEKLRQALPR